MRISTKWYYFKSIWVGYRYSRKNLSIICSQIALVLNICYRKSGIQILPMCEIEGATRILKIEKSRSSLNLQFDRNFVWLFFFSLNNEHKKYLSEKTSFSTPPPHEHLFRCGSRSVRRKIELENYYFHWLFGRVFIILLFGICYEKDGVQFCLSVRWKELREYLKLKNLIVTQF